MKRLVPRLSGRSRPHMILPTEHKLRGIFMLLDLLFKLDIINNREIIAIPDLGDHTYYHEFL